MMRTATSAYRKSMFAAMMPADAGRSSLLLVLADGGKSRDPRPCRAEPVLPPRLELAALAQDADAHRVGRLRPLARRGRIDRRSATGTERLNARIAAVRRGLEIGRRRSRHSKRRAGHRNRDAERRARAGLTIGAVADRGLLRIGLALDRDVAAVARAVDLHGLSPLPPILDVGGRINLVPPSPASAAETTTNEPEGRRSPPPSADRASQSSRAQLPGRAHRASLGSISRLRTEPAPASLRRDLPAAVDCFRIPQTRARGRARAHREK